jgi:phosphoserine/homoserine phosphotransferase
VEADVITGYELRMVDQKRHAVDALRSLRYRVLAAGDSYNDISMLTAADVGMLFRAPEKVRAEFPMFAAVDDYDELLRLLVAEL